MPSPVLRVWKCRVLLGGSYGDLGSRLGNPYNPYSNPNYPHDSPCQTVHIRPSKDLYGDVYWGYRGVPVWRMSVTMHWKLYYIGEWL